MLFCLAGSMCSACSNVAYEWVLKHNSHHSFWEQMLVGNGQGLPRCLFSLFGLPGQPFQLSLSSSLSFAAHRIQLSQLFQLNSFSLLQPFSPLKPRQLSHSIPRDALN